MGQTQVVRGRATNVWTDEDGCTNVRYHTTIVVSFNLDKILLNKGGWSTVTTKARMNQASNQYGLNYYVFQKNFQWFVKRDTGEIVPFGHTTLLLHR